MTLSDSDLQAKLKEIKMLALDVDGVLTDGRLLLGEDNREFRSFDVKDGFGIRALTLSGIKVAVISGRESEVVKRRCEHLGIKDICQKVMKKHEVFKELLEKYDIEAGEACFIGDDINDMSVLKRAGLSVCVADTSPELKEVCDIITSRPGGRGAVREVAELILKAQGRWEAVEAEFS